MSEEKKYLGQESLSRLSTNIKSYVDNKIDPALDDASSNAIRNSAATIAINSKLDASKKGAANGVAELDANGKVPASQLPSYVDDIVDCYYDSETEKLYEHKDSTDPEHPIYSDEITPEADKIYVDKDSNALYRWTGSMIVSPGSANALTLGETAQTAYRGDRGKTAYDDSQANKTNIGTMSSLTTTETGTLVGAINEVKAEVGGKVDKVTGKGLSTNDYDATEKAEVAKVKDKQNKSLTTAVTIDGVSKSSVEEAISALTTLANATAAMALNKISIADAFDNTAEYAIGDYCIYDNKLYKAKAAHQGAWDADDFDQKQVMDEITDIMVSSYTSLSDLPQIGGTTLIGNKTYSELGIQQSETGKGLSTNDYTDEAKAIVDGVTAALAAKQPKTLETAVSVEGGSITTVQGLAGSVATHTSRSVTDNTGAHGLKVTAVSEDEDAIYYKSGNDWKQIQLGSVTQLAEMPTAAAKYVGKIYQYVGTTTQDYKKGYFYECVNSAGVYAWQAVRVQSGGGQTIQYDPLPTAEASLVGALLQYIGTTNANYTRGHFYECVAGETAGTFVWKEVEVNESETIQYESIPPINEDTLDSVIQYVGETNAFFDKGAMYTPSVYNNPPYNFLTNPRFTYFRENKGQDSTVTYTAETGGNVLAIAIDMCNGEWNREAKIETTGEVNDSIYVPMFESGEERASYKVSNISLNMGDTITFSIKEPRYDPYYQSQAYFVFDSNVGILDMENLFKAVAGSISGVNTKTYTVGKDEKLLLFSFVGANGSYKTAVGTNYSHKLNGKEINNEIIFDTNTYSGAIVSSIDAKEGDVITLSADAGIDGSANCHYVIHFIIGIDNMIGWNKINLGDGQTIQYNSMPLANDQNLGSIVQYTGETTSSYIKGTFYECVKQIEVIDNNETINYTWVESLQNTQYEKMPQITDMYNNKVIQYIGQDTTNYKTGHMYKVGDYTNLPYDFSSTPKFTYFRENQSQDSTATYTAEKNENVLAIAIDMCYGEWNREARIATTGEVNDSVDIPMFENGEERASYKTANISLKKGDTITFSVKEPAYSPFYQSQAYFVFDSNIGILDMENLFKAVTGATSGVNTKTYAVEKDEKLLLVSFVGANGSSRTAVGSDYNHKINDNAITNNIIFDDNDYSGAIISCVDAKEGDIITLSANPGTSGYADGHYVIHFVIGIDDMIGWQEIPFAEQATLTDQDIADIKAAFDRGLAPL